MMKYRGYSQYIRILALVSLIGMAAFWCIGGAQLNQEAARFAAVMKEAESAVTVGRKEKVRELSSDARIIDCSILEKEPVYELTEEDYDMLLRIVEAEAGGEDENGKLLVANVVLNRVNSDVFPNSVTEVVCQKENGVYQFSPVKDGRLTKVRVSEETKRAVERAIYGEDISQGALYFMARSAVSEEKLSWFDNKLTWLFAYGGHEFFE